ncbi:hypothetical protein PAHAL_5G031300 [Panicum hallii]|uniref:Uncharacterized protein n=1 Tax=Panicum hallii TaxID=206008 RepID=A0A2T8IIS0_9POAL|nr:hypothetical protein PAHAL_5G031300 [Panicum hallii]
MLVYNTRRENLAEKNYKKKNSSLPLTIPCCVSVIINLLFFLTRSRSLSLASLF